MVIYDECAATWQGPVEDLEGVGRGKGGRREESGEVITSGGGGVEEVAGKALVASQGGSVAVLAVYYAGGTVFG